MRKTEKQLGNQYRSIINGVTINLNPQERFNILKARKKKTYFINILSSKVGRQENFGNCRRNYQLFGKLMFVNQIFS